MTESDDPWLQILHLYKTAVFNQDVKAFMAIYDEDVQVFDMWGSWSLRGAKAWRAMAEGWFSSVGEERVIVAASEIQTTSNGDLALGYATLTFTALSAEGKQLRSMDNRITAALKRSGGAWKIFHQHTSAPIDPRSMKPVLRRDPKG